MIEMILRSTRIYAIQNGLAALVFSALLLADILAHLLDRYPATEILWRLTTVSNRTVNPLLGKLGNAVDSPALLLLILAIAVAVPLLSWRFNHLLGTAASGHVALGALVVICYEAMKRANTGNTTASLSNAFDPRLLDTNVTSMLCLTAITAVFCTLNHVAFFGRMDRSLKR